jgi:hypothetical protein
VRARPIHPSPPTFPISLTGLNIPFSLYILILISIWWLSPLFVTWNARTRRSSGGSGGGGGWNTRLRGCIGTFDAQPLRAGLAEYALLSAFRDHRFRRVELRELPSLECGCVFLLVPPPLPSALATCAYTQTSLLSFYVPPP